MRRLLAPNRGLSAVMIMRDLLPNMRSLSALLPIPDLFLAGRRPAVDPSMSKVPPLRPRVEIPICDPGPDAEPVPRPAGGLGNTGSGDHESRCKPGADARATVDRVTAVRGRAYRHRCGDCRNPCARSDTGRGEHPRLAGHAARGAA